MRKTNSLLAIVLATVSVVFVVQGQKTQSTKSKPKPASQGNTQTRSRRSSAESPSATPTTPALTETPTATASPAEKLVDQKPTSSPSDPKATSSPAAAASPAPSDSPKPSASPATAEATPVPTPEDPVMSLREEIDAAETPLQRVQLQLKLADLHLTKGNKPEALAELHRVTTTDAFAPEEIYNAGNFLARLGDMDGAIAAYRKAIEQRNGNYSRAYNNLGVILLRAGRWQESYEALTSALKIEGFHYAEASYNLGRLYAARGENDLAVHEWRRTLTINPNHTGAREALARVGKEGTVQVGGAKVPPPPKSPKPPQASDKPVSMNAPTTKPAVVTVERDTYNFLMRARTSGERGKFDDAVINYKKAISSNGGYLPPANLELSYLLITHKQYDEALDNLLRVTNRDGARFPISYFHLARVYEARGDFKQAESAFGQAAAAFQPPNNQFLLDVSRVREKQGNYQGALEALEQYVERMKQQGQVVTWSDERVSALRQKLNSPK